MAKVNMQEWYSANKTKLEELKEAFVNAMLEDEDFFFFYGDDVIYDHDLKFKYATQINLEPIDDVISELERAEFILPDKPPEMDADNIERYKTHVFDDYRLDGFEAKLKEIYSAFSVPTAFNFNSQPLHEAIQTAFYEYKYDRDKEALIHKIDDAANAWAADGYTNAPGAFSYAISQMINDFDRNRYDTTESVFGELAQTVQNNIRSSIENGIKIEELHMDFAIKYSELSKVFIQSAVDSYVAEIQKRIDEQNAQIQKIKYLTKTMGLDHKADLTKHQLELEERTARLAAYTSASNSYISTKAGSVVDQLKLAQNISEGYGAIFSSYGSLFTGVSYEE